MLSFFSLLLSEEQTTKQQQHEQQRSTSGEVPTGRCVRDEGPSHEPERQHAKARVLRVLQTSDGGPMQIKAPGMLDMVGRHKW